MNNRPSFRETLPFLAALALASSPGEHPQSSPALSQDPDEAAIRYSTHEFIADALADAHYPDSDSFLLSFEPAPENRATIEPL